MGSTFLPTSAVAASVPSLTLLMGTVSTLRPAFFAVAAILSFRLTESGSAGLKRMPTFLTLGTTRLISSIRLACSGSPKPGE